METEYDYSPNTANWKSKTYFITSYLSQKTLQLQLGFRNSRIGYFEEVHLLDVCDLTYTNAQSLT